MFNEILVYKYYDFIKYIFQASINFKRLLLDNQGYLLECEFYQLAYFIKRVVSGLDFLRDSD